MVSTPTREPDPSHVGVDQTGIEAAQAAESDRVVMAVPMNGTSRDAVSAQPADAAEPVKKAPGLRRRLPRPRSRTPRQGRHRRTSRWLLGASGLMLLAALGLGLWLTVTVLAGKSSTELGDTAGGAPPPAFAPYRDPQGRFSLYHPSTWQQEPSSASQAALLLRTDPSSQNSMLVRIVPLDEPVGPEQLAEARKLTDSLVQASDVNVVVVRQITLNGVPGYYYLYTFGEPGSDRFGIHAHYFLFSESTMHVLVFQALPDTEFVDLAPDFDAIARSYRVP